MAARRLFLAEIRSGLLPLPEGAAHHLTGVLRLDVGAPVTVFDAAGRTADAVLVRLTGDSDGEGGTRWGVEVGDVREPPPRHLLTVASAVPKGERADWLVEKLAELGVARWAPLRTERSVVHPEGTGKRERWQRLATEAARQSGAPGVLSVGELASLETVIPCAGKVAWLCSTEPGAVAACEASRPDVIFVGPEGGWSAAEDAALRAGGAVAVTLGKTTLRVETAALVAAACALQNEVMAR